MLVVRFSDKWSFSCMQIVLPFMVISKITETWFYLLCVCVCEKESEIVTVWYRNIFCFLFFLNRCRCFFQPSPTDNARKLCCIQFKALYFNVVNTPKWKQNEMMGTDRTNWTNWAIENIVQSVYLTMYCSHIQLTSNITTFQYITYSWRINITTETTAAAHSLPAAPSPLNTHFMRH